MSSGGLDFLVIGAMKAGTTSLFEYLRTHPGLYVPPAKDLPFFSHDNVYRRGWDAYARAAFDKAPDGRLRGTVTPQYMGVPRWSAETVALAEAHPGGVVPERISRLFPRIRLVALLRDPIARAISHYWFSVRHGLERRSLSDALRESLSVSCLSSARRVPTYTNSYVALGEYGRMLEAYLSRFSRSQLFVGSTETLASDPEGLLGDVWRFLGVDDSHVPENIGLRYHVGSPGRRLPVNPWRLPSAIRATPLRYAWAAIPGGTSEMLKNRYRTAAFRFSQWNRSRQPRPAERPDPELSKRLRVHYAGDRALLESLVGPVRGVTSAASAPALTP